MSEKHMIYLHPVPLRIWHWTNALSFIILFITGIQIRFSGHISLFSFQGAVSTHQFFGFVLIFNYIFWFIFQVVSGQIKNFVPNLQTVIPASIRQAAFYGYGVFKGAPNPHHLSPDNKYNAMQQQAYIAIMFALIPLQLITGLCLWKIEMFQPLISMVGGLKIVDTVHVLLFFFFMAFMITHIYLATLGATVLAHIKGMITGWEESH